MTVPIRVFGTPMVGWSKLLADDVTSSTHTVYSDSTSEPTGIVPVIGSRMQVRVYGGDAKDETVRTAIWRFARDDDGLYVPDVALYLLEWKLGADSGGGVHHGYECSVVHALRYDYSINNPSAVGGNAADAQKAVFDFDSTGGIVVIDPVVVTGASVNVCVRPY